MKNCAGCGVELDPTIDEVNHAVDQVLETSVKDAYIKGGVCPLCGHSKDVPYSHRRTVQFALLLGTLAIATVAAFLVYQSRQTARSKVANEILERLNQNQPLSELLGQPIRIGRGIQGEVKRDETGWSETQLTIPVVGPKGSATVRAVGGRGTGPWIFTTLEAVVEAQHKKIDLIVGRIVEYDPAVYVDVHTLAAKTPELGNFSAAAPVMSGSFPCAYASADDKSWSPQLGDCSIALPMAESAPLDRYEVDLRYGSFLVRQTDLLLKGAIDVPFTRTYNSNDWIHPNRAHAFGNNANHVFDFAPLGSRNPYTYQWIAFGDGNSLYFDRISKGTGYADSVFQHTETSTAFYGAITRWNGRGWTTQLKDGSQIFFPESYNAKNMAQGAAWEITDGKGNKTVLVRDGKRDLQEIRAPGGGVIKFQYDTFSRVTRAEDSQGHWAAYRYNSDGMLTDVSLSSGKERHYAYEGHLMTSIRDEHGRYLVQNFYGNAYSATMLDHQITEAGRYSYRYEIASSGRYVERVVVTLPDGSTQKIEAANAVPGFIKRL